MKKYIFLGLLAGTAISLLLYFYKQNKFLGMEFEDFVDSSSIADDLFGNAFSEIPDKL